MVRRFAVAVLCLATTAPTAFRALAARPRPHVTCTAVGMGDPPRHWIGCEGDPGPRRDLSGQEKLMAGIAIDVNGATPEDLAGVPGLSPRLAVAIAADRASRGPYATLDELVRVRGIGPARLARARPFLAIRP